MKWVKIWQTSGCFGFAFSVFQEQPRICRITQIWMKIFYAFMTLVSSIHHIWFSVGFLIPHMDIYISDGTDFILCNYEILFLEISLM